MSEEQKKTTEALWTWESEDGRFSADVHRLKPFVGKLTVTETSGDGVVPPRVLDTQEVTITMDHRFGPDHQDLVLWIAKARAACGLPVEDDE